jgi:putative heme-binding domain-containing protein
MAGESARPGLRAARRGAAAAVLGAALIAITAIAEPPAAQTRDATPHNPFQPTPQIIQEGMAAFRANCAYCHGMDAKGMRGPDLTNVFSGGATEEGLYGLVRRGVPGTEMPAATVFLPEPDTWKVLMYLRTLNVPAPSEPPRGNAENGERIFRAQCRSCHRVDGEGGVMGPDLSRIGIGRTRAALTRQIRGSVEDLRPGYEPVTITLEGGRTVRGTRKNEDLFSIQIMDSTERLQGIVKSDARTVTSEKRSLMPAYPVEQLSESDLDDLLRYLGTLRAPAPAALR